MTVSLRRRDWADAAAVAAAIRDAGVAGAGGAGFPTHAKWARLDEVSHLLVNHQESEPNFYMDKWLGGTRADAFARLFDALLDGPLDSVVVCAKETYRAAWMAEFEAATDATVHGPEDLPLDPAAAPGAVFAYTDDRYEYDMESVLLRIVADVVLRDGLPMDYGWIVRNTETLYNLIGALEEGRPVTRKYVHVDGAVGHHRFLDVPVGTLASTLLEAAGRSPDDLDADEVLADGGPGWRFETEASPSRFGVTKRTNCLLVLDGKNVAGHTIGGGRINVLASGDWERDHETKPTTLDPDAVRVPLVTNPDLAPVVVTSDPVVAPGDRVATGEVVATPGADGIGNTQHASIDGEVTDVTDTHVEIRRGPALGAAGETGA